MKRLTKERSDPADWEENFVRAANALEEAIESGNVKDVLDEIRLAEESRLLHP